MLSLAPGYFMSFDVAADDVIWIGNVVEQVVTGISANAGIASDLKQEFNIALADLVVNPLPTVHLLGLGIEVPVCCFDKDDSSLSWSIVGLEELPELGFEGHQEFIPDFYDGLGMLNLDIVIRLYFLELAHILRMEVLLEDWVDSCVFSLLFWYVGLTLHGGLSFVDQLLQFLTANTLMDILPLDFIKVWLIFNGFFSRMTLINYFMDELNVYLLFDFGWAAEA